MERIRKTLETLVLVSIGLGGIFQCDVSDPEEPIRCVGNTHGNPG